VHAGRQVGEPVMAEKWQKTSSPPSSGLMKPNPFSFHRSAMPVSLPSEPPPPRRPERERWRRPERERERERERSRSRRPPERERSRRPERERLRLLDLSFLSALERLRLLDFSSFFSGDLAGDLAGEVSRAASSSAILLTSGSRSDS